MKTVATLQEAMRVEGAVMVEASDPPRVYFAGDALPAHCVVPQRAERAESPRERLESATGLTIEQIKEALK